MYEPRSAPSRLSRLAGSNTVLRWESFECATSTPIATIIASGGATLIISQQHQLDDSTTFTAWSEEVDNRRILTGFPAQGALPQTHQWILTDWSPCVISEMSSMYNPRIDQLRWAAVAALEDAEALLCRAELSADEKDGWTPDFAKMLADGIAACRWFVSMGFATPGNFGYWLFRIKEGHISVESSHKELDSAVDAASRALYDLDKERARGSEHQRDTDGAQDFS